VVYRAAGLEVLQAAPPEPAEVDPRGVMFGPARAYPLTFVRGDERFSEQLVKSMAALLASHGYPPLDNTDDWSDFETALAGFLYTHDRKEPKP
jgi:hypothetical protein